MNIKEVVDRIENRPDTIPMAITEVDVLALLAHIKDLEAENEANEEIKNELIDSINKNGERIQELMKKNNRKWEYHYDMTESDGDVFYITDKNTNVSLTDQSIVNFMTELEAENERLREMIDNILNEWEGQCAVFGVGDYEDQKKYRELLDTLAKDNK